MYSESEKPVSIVVVPAINKSTAADAANKAALFTLKGGLTLFSTSIISFDPYPHPTRRPAKP